MQISGRFNIGQNYDYYIISAIRDYFGGDVKIQTIVSAKHRTKKNFQRKENY